MVRPGTSLLRAGLELSRDPGLGRQRHIFNAFSGAVVRIGTKGRKRDSSAVLVLEYWRKHYHVFVFSFPARSGRRDRLSAELDHLHSQSDADSEAQARLHRSNVVSTSARKRIITVTKKDPRVEAYIKNAQPFARPILKHLRKLVHRACPDAEETIKWRMPFFERKGIVCFMAAFKQHAAFDFWKGELLFGKENRGAMRNFGRIKSLKDLPSDEDIIRYVKKAAELNERGVQKKRTPRRARKLQVPPDLKSALSKNAKARKTFENFSYTNRHEYVDWIASAKRDETRQRRLRTAMTWLAQGKPQNWKYL
jgi:uncharacterized protein YdeI (YjbR/CyaY-like superfamily)